MAGGFLFMNRSGLFRSVSLIAQVSRLDENARESLCNGGALKNPCRSMREEGRHRSLCSVPAYTLGEARPMCVRSPRRTGRYSNAGHPKRSDSGVEGLLDSGPRPMPEANGEIETTLGRSLWGGLATGVRSEARHE